MFGNARNGIVKIGDTEMHYAAFGTGKKTLVLLPGLSDGLATVQGKAALLARPYRLFFGRYTVYLFSRKEQMPEGYSIRDMAADQVAAMQSLGIERAAVMGVSEGGMIAQFLAIDHPETVEKLVLAVTAPCISPMIEANVTRWVRLAESGEHKKLMIDTSENSYSEARLMKMRKLYPLIGLIGKPKTYERFFRNADAILRFDALSELDKIKCPTLILAGGQDKTVGVEASYTLHERIKNSTLHVYPELGHAAFEEAPDFNQRVYDFLETPAYGFYGWETATIRDASGLTPRDYYDRLKSVWSADTCAPRMRADWSKENPTLGQCSITAFLMQDIYGGKVLGVPLDDGNYHCFNAVNGCVFDLTSEQFQGVPLNYTDCPEQSRETHFAKEEKRLRYELLKQRLFAGDR